MQSPSTDSELLTPQQAAREIGASVDSIRRRIWSGELAHYRLGTGPKAPIRVSRGDLTAYLLKHYKTVSKPLEVSEPV
jgi:excisionase family DNA binding protein